MKIVKQLHVSPFFHRSRKPPCRSDAEMLKVVARFNLRVSNKEIPFEEVRCLCSSEEFALISEVDRYGLIQSTVICTKCGLIQSNTRMTAEYYRLFYESDEYRRLYDGDSFIHDYEQFYTSERGSLIFNTVSEYKELGKSDSVLEVGAGGGWNLVPFIEKGCVDDQ